MLVSLGVFHWAIFQVGHPEPTLISAKLDTGAKSARCGPVAQRVHGGWVAGHPVL